MKGRFVNDLGLLGRQDESTKKQQIFKFLTGLKLGNMPDSFSSTGEMNLARKFSVSLEFFKETVLEFRKGGCNE